MLKIPLWLLSHDSKKYLFQHFITSRFTFLWNFFFGLFRQPRILSIQCYLYDICNGVPVHIGLHVEFSSRSDFTAIYISNYKKHSHTTQHPHSFSSHSYTIVRKISLLNTLSKSVLQHKQADSHINVIYSSHSHSFTHNAYSLTHSHTYTPRSQTLIQLEWPTEPSE